MKLSFLHAGAVRRLGAMTLPEVLISMTLFIFAVAGLLSTNIFIMRYDELNNSQLGASDQSRVNFEYLEEEIRSALNVQIGTGWHTNFVPITNLGSPQIGDTIQIIPSTNATVSIYYYFQTNAPTNSSWLVRVATTNGVYTTNLVAQNLTNMTSQWLSNACIFEAFDYTGTNIMTNDPTSTNYTHNYMVAALLQFYQYQYPLTYVGTNAMFDYYQLQLMATRRTP
jgi:hypothetical protein